MSAIKFRHSECNEESENDRTQIYFESECFFVSQNEANKRIIVLNRLSLFLYLHSTLSIS